MKRVLLSIVGCCLVAWPAFGGSAVAVNVTPSVGMAPATVRVRVLVEPNARNRVLTVETDSGEFYSSSQITLDGDRSSRVQWFEVRNLPPGQYIVQATLDRSDGDRQIAQAQYAVTGGW